MVYKNYCSYTIHRIKSNSIIMESGCIEWIGTKNNRGYGMIGLAPAGYKSPVPAHRAMYMAINEKWDLPRNVFIRHKCDNPSCVNINHLEAGTPKDNMQDCIERGRRATKYKPHTRHYVLDDDIVRAIRAATGKQKWIAQQFGVSIGYVSKLRSGKAKTLV